MICSHQRSLSDTDLPRGGRQFHKCLASAPLPSPWLPAAGSFPRGPAAPALLLDRMGIQALWIGENNDHNFGAGAETPSRLCGNRELPVRIYLRRASPPCIRWVLGPSLRDAKGCVRSDLQFLGQHQHGVVTHPKLVRGYVAHSGAVRASVTVQDKFASGSGRLSSNSGRGTWSGYSGSARCSGYWTAVRN